MLTWSHRKPNHELQWGLQELNNSMSDYIVLFQKFEKKNIMKIGFEEKKQRGKSALIFLFWLYAWVTSCPL